MASREDMERPIYSTQDKAYWEAAAKFEKSEAAAASAFGGIVCGLLAATFIFLLAKAFGWL